MFRDKSTAAEVAMPTASEELFAASAAVSATRQASLNAFNISRKICSLSRWYRVTSE